MKGTVRSPGMVVLLSIVTCGIYLVYWYFQTLDEMRAAGFDATGNPMMMDFLLADRHRARRLRPHGHHVGDSPERAQQELECRRGHVAGQVALAQSWRA